MLISLENPFTSYSHGTIILMVVYSKPTLWRKFPFPVWQLLGIVLFYCPRHIHDPSNLTFDPNDSFWLFFSAFGNKSFRQSFILSFLFCCNDWSFTPVTFAFDIRRGSNLAILQDCRVIGKQNNVDYSLMIMLSFVLFTQSEPPKQQNQHNTKLNKHLVEGQLSKNQNISIIL